MALHYLHTPCLLNSVLDQFADCPIDLVPLILSQAEDVEDNVVKGLAVGEGIGFLVTNGEAGVDSEFFITRFNLSQL